MKFSTALVNKFLKRAQLSGEYWIDTTGFIHGADSNIDRGHAEIAFESALEVDFDDPNAPEMFPMESLSDEAISWLKENGANEDAIEYFKDGSDPRDYAIDHMGWIRVIDGNFQTQEFNEESLDRIADFLSEMGAEDLDENILIEDQHHKTWELPVKKVMNPEATAEALKHYAEGVGRFAFKSKLAQEIDLFSNLLRLHELWYKIKGLEEKFSGAAEKVKEEYKADFYTEAPKTIEEIIYIFDEWVQFHSKDGWWNHAKELLGVFKQGFLEFHIHGKDKMIDFRPCIKSQMEKDPETVWGKDWFKLLYNDIKREYLENCKDFAWEQWQNFFPEYEKTVRQVEVIVGKLKSVLNSNDIDNIMSAISLSLNTAHNSGLMYEHLNMTEEELNLLSNLDTSAWDAEIRRYAKKFQWSSIIKKS